MRQRLEDIIEQRGRLEAEKPKLPERLEIGPPSRYISAVVPNNSECVRVEVGSGTEGCQRTFTLSEFREFCRQGLAMVDGGPEPGESIPPAEIERLAAIAWAAGASHKDPSRFAALEPTHQRVWCERIEAVLASLGNRRPEPTPAPSPDPVLCPYCHEPNRISLDPKQVYWGCHNEECYADGPLNDPTGAKVRRLTRIVESHGKLLEACRLAGSYIGAQPAYVGWKLPEILASAIAAAEEAAR